MSDYFKAHSERLAHVHNKMIELGAEIVEMGYDVFIPNVKENHGKITFMKIINKEKTKSVGLQFNEVPYGFSVYIYLNPSAEFGSSRTVEKFFPVDCKTPPPAQEVLKWLSANPSKKADTHLIPIQEILNTDNDNTQEHAS